MKKVEVLVISLFSPLKVGVYENKTLIKEYISEEKTSEILPLFFAEIIKEYEIESLYYTKGPGSYMSIKIAYIFLKSMSILNGYKLKGALGFVLNGNSAIPAMRGLYFVNEDDGVVIKKVDGVEPRINLPTKLEKELFDEESAPFYKLPVV